MTMRALRSALNFLLVVFMAELILCRASGNAPTTLDSCLANVGE